MSTMPRKPDGTVDEDAFRDPPGVQVISLGLCCASVCSALPIAEVKAFMASYPTGIASRWTLSEDTHFSNGPTNPCPCEQLPETHTHYLFNC